MSDYLNDLPTELVEKILDHISIVDILSSVCLVNRRLYSISRTLTYSRIPLDFNIIARKKKHFDLLCKDLPNLTSRIVSLTFDNSDNRITFAKNIRFLCSITKNYTFPNLHSITLNKINLNVWNVFRIRLPSFMALRSMSISAVVDSTQSTLIPVILHDLLFTVRSLKHLFLHKLPCRYGIISISSTFFAMQTSTIEYLTLKGIQINLHKLLVAAPMLRRLDVKLFVRQHIYNNMIFQTPVDLQQLSITIDYITMLEIQCLLSLMTRLTHLTLHIDKTKSDLINGHTWMPLLTKIMVFQFMFGISKKNNVDLDSFRTPFWLEEKKWYVTYDRWINTSVSFLYTNPCCTEYRHPLPSTKKTLVTKSTGLKPMTFPYTGYLIFDWNLPMSKEHVCRFTHAHALTTNGDLDLSLKYIISCIDLSRITSFVQGGPKIEQSGNEFVDILHSLPHLRSLCLNISTVILLLDRHWPKVIDLDMKNDSPHPYQCLSSTEIDKFCHSFTHLKQFAFDRQNVRMLSRLFNSITMTLSNILIRHYDKLSGYNPQVITREWVEQHTKLNDFDYFNDSWRDVYIWV